jgi:ATP-dependent DNA ligase
LSQLCRKLAVPEVVFSPAVMGAGIAFFRNVVSAGHEGVVAKLQSSAYRPGKRTMTWKKIKRRAGKE